MASFTQHQIVTALHRPVGQDHEGVEYTVEPGAQGVVVSVDAREGVTVIYWIDSERHIVQVYSEADDDLGCIAPGIVKVDTASSRSRQHFIDTGRYLTESESAEEVAFESRPVRGVSQEEINRALADLLMYENGSSGSPCLWIAVWDEIKRLGYYDSSKLTPAGIKAAIALEPTPTASTPSAGVAIPGVLTWQRIADLVCSAVEGGSTYWCGSLRMRKVDRKNYTPSCSYPWYCDPAFWASTGWRLRATDAEGDDGPWDLWQHQLAERVAKWAKDRPGDLADVMAENDDASTGDVFLQYLLFGEVVYG